MKQLYRRRHGAIPAGACGLAHWSHPLRCGTGIERGDTTLEFAGNVLGRGGLAEANWLSDRNLHVAWTGPNFLRLLPVEQTIEMSGDDRHAQPRGQLTNPGAERRHPSIARQFPLGENQHAPATVNQVASKSETLAEAGSARQRKNIEERHKQEVFCTIQ